MREHSEVGAVNSLMSVEGKGSSVSRVGCFKCDGAQFQRDCNASQNAGTQSSGKGNQGKSWPKSESSITGRGKGHENNGKSKGKSNGTKGAIQVSKGPGNGKTLKTGISDLENSKSETSVENKESVQMGQVCITKTLLIHKEWSHDDWNDDEICVGSHEDCERRCYATASSLSLESSEIVTADRDTRSTGNTFLVKFDREGAGDGCSYSGVEAWQCQGYDEKCQI